MGGSDWAGWEHGIEALSVLTELDFLQQALTFLAHSVPVTRVQFWDQNWPTFKSQVRYHHLYPTLLDHRITCCSLSLLKPWTTCQLRRSSTDLGSFERIILCVCVCVCVCVLSRFIHAWLSAILWIVVCQASLSMRFSRQEYWSGLPCPGDLSSPGIESESLMSPVLASGFFTTNATWEDRHTMCAVLNHFSCVWLFATIYCAKTWRNEIAGESQGRRSLAGCCLRGRTESDTTEAT